MGTFIVNKINRWQINDKKLKEKLKKEKISLFDYNKIKEYILKEVINNKHFLKFCLKNLENNKNFKYDLFYPVEVGDTPIIISITPSVLIKSFDKYNNSNWEKYLKKTLSKKVNNNTTYKDIINILLSDNKEFDNMISNNNFLNIKGEELIEILKNYPINYYEKSDLDEMFLPDMLSLSSEEKERFSKNIQSLTYFFEKDEMDSYNFTGSSNLTDEFDLSSELEQKIMSEIPKEFDEIQKTYYIYKRLCQLFSYDQEYFYLLNNNKVEENTINHTNLNRLSTLQGGEEVICSGVSLIFAKILNKLKIPNVLLNYKNELCNSVGRQHMKVRFLSENCIIDADPADGLFQSDLVSEKIHGRTKSFKLVNTVQRKVDLFSYKINQVNSFFDENFLEYNDAREIYQNLYKKENAQLNFMQKVKLLIDVVRLQKYSLFELIELISKIKKQFFKENKDKIAIEFIVNKSSKPIKLNLLIGYNDNDKVLDKLNENCYIILDDEKKLSTVDYKELKRRFDIDMYDFTQKERNLFNLKGENSKDEKRSSVNRNI